MSGRLHGGKGFEPQVANFLFCLHHRLAQLHQNVPVLVSRFYKDAVFDTNEYPGHRRAEAGNIKKSRAFAVPPVIPAEL